MTSDTSMENAEIQVAADQRGKQENIVVMTFFYNERPPAPPVPSDSSSRFMAVEERSLRQLLRFFGSCGSTNSKLSFQSETTVFFEVFLKFLESSE